jgi:hypothetical protein
MRRLDWWLGIGCIAATLLLQAVFPRYEWHAIDESRFVRIDRWAGEAEVGRFVPDSEAWRTLWRSWGAR